jgi:excisionase family DNA binding protein
MPTEPRLLTSGQLARALGVAPRTVARWAQDGWITPAQITAGGHFRWKLEDVQAELAKRRESDK